MAEVAETFQRSLIENVIFQIADSFEIKVQWDKGTAVITGLFTLVGTVIGYYWNDRGDMKNALVGAGVGGATGFGVATVVSLRQIWKDVKEKLSELYSIVYNYLRSLHPEDYIGGFNKLMECMASRQKLAVTIIEFVEKKLGTKVWSNINVASMST